MADRESAKRNSGPQARVGKKNTTTVLEQLTRTIDLLAQQISKTK